MGTKKPETGYSTQKLPPMPSGRPSVTIAALVTLSRSDTPARAPFGPTSSFPLALRPVSEKNCQSIRAAKPATKSAKVAFAPLTNETASVPSVPSPMPLASDSPMTLSDQDAAVTPFAPVAPAPPPQSATASGVAESPSSSAENTDEMVESITRGVDSLATIARADEAESSSGVEQNTSGKKKKRRGYFSIMQAKYEKLAHNAKPSHILDQQQVGTNHDHLTGPEQSPVALRPTMSSIQASRTETLLSGPLKRSRAKTRRLRLS
jgi:hypothetical protein